MGVLTRDSAEVRARWRTFTQWRIYGLTRAAFFISSDGIRRIGTSKCHPSSPDAETVCLPCGRSCICGRQDHLDQPDVERVLSSYFFPVARQNRRRLCDRCCNRFGSLCRYRSCARHRGTGSNRKIVGGRYYSGEPASPSSSRERS